MAKTAPIGALQLEVGLIHHLPNLISVLRILLVAPLMLALLSRRYEIALWIGAAAGVSDGVDGFLARHFRWQSRLGSILDPAADKLMLVGCMLGFAWLGEAPHWLVALVVARDVVIALGALAWRSVLGAFEAHPSLLSKATTVAQIGFVLLVLADQAFNWNAPMRMPVWIVAVLTAASGLDYVLRWGTRAQRALRARGKSG